MIRTLRIKFVMINMILVFLVLAAVFGALCVTSYRQVGRDNEMTLRMAASRAKEVEPPKMEVGKEPPETFVGAPVFVVQFDAGGNFMYVRTENMYIEQDEAAEIAQAAREAGGESGVLPEYNLRYAVVNKYGRDAIAFMDRHSERTALRNVVLISLASFAGALLAFFLISLYLSKWALKPVERALLQQRRFVANASHELKTPLTVILANTGILQKNGEATVQSQRQWIDSTQAEAQRMKRLVEDLVFLAKSDEAKTPAPFAPVQFGDLVYSVCLAFESLAYEKGISLETAGIEADVVLQGDAAQLRQLAAILVDNAVKYAARDSAVTVTLTKKQARVCLSVHNCGSPIPPNALPHLFDRFYRVDWSRAEGGYGLGLSIAKTIAELHHGRLWAANENDGVTFRAEFRDVPARRD